MKGGHHIITQTQKIFSLLQTILMTLMRYKQGGIMVTPYLRYDGNCEEAFNFYADAFGGDVCSLSRLNNDPKNKVMHAQVMLTESGAVSGSDTMKPNWDRSSIEIIVHLSREKIEDVLAKLSVGGTVISGFVPHPPPDDEGGGAVVRDKYGYTWFLCA
jgi:PhnB protein